MIQHGETVIHRDDMRLPKRGGYRELTAADVPGYLRRRAGIPGLLGGSPSRWRAREMGDGNLNLVFIVTGPAGSVIVKQALPYVRMVGRGWPLSLSRSHFEHRALRQQATWGLAFVPAVHDADPAMACIVMQCLSPHTVLRKGIIRAVRYPCIGRHIGTFLAHAAFFTSDLHLAAAAKKALFADFLGNTAMCKISEDLIFDEPYFAAPMNRHTAPHLDAAAAALRSDVALKLAAQEMKWCFLNQPECLIHGDLHTGSIMATAGDTRVIDPEFACYGPMGFDVGMLVGNLFMAYLSQPGHATPADDRGDYGDYLLEQIRALWETFAESFAALWRSRSNSTPGGQAFHPRLCLDAPALVESAIERRLAAIWKWTLGFAGVEMIRRIVGLSHIEDFESIADAKRRAECEMTALRLGRELLVNPSRYRDIHRLIDGAKAHA